MTFFDLLSIRTVLTEALGQLEYDISHGHESREDREDDLVELRRLIDLIDHLSL